MKVIAFYSYKGGVGRTMSLLSTAYTLAQRGRKVVVADWDLQAPGLSLMECMRPEDAGPPRVGILEFLTGLHPDRWHEPQPDFEKMLLAPRLIDWAGARGTADDKTRMRGDLFFIPAGDLGEGVEHFIQNVQRADLHNLQRFLEKIDPDPRMVFKVFRQKVETAAIAWRGEGQEGPPDYLLIDCRTGITEIGELLLGDATDFTVIVYGQGEQNLEGLRIVLNASQREPGDLAANTMLIWSGEVAGQEELKVCQQRHKRQIIKDICRPDSLCLPEPFPKEFDIPFNPDLVFSDVPLVHRVPEGEFAGKFQEITDYLEERCLWEDKIIESIVAPIDPQAPESEERRRMKIAETPATKRSGMLQRAHLELALSSGLTSLLFCPPSWNLARIPTPEIAVNWPTGFDSTESRKLFLQLLAYSTSRTSSEKRNIINRIHELTAFQVRELLRLLRDERHGWLSLPPNFYWSLIGQTLSAGMEWLAMLAQPTRSPADGQAVVETGEISTELAGQLDRVLGLIVGGESIADFAESKHPLFPLLVAETLRNPVPFHHPKNRNRDELLLPKLGAPVNSDARGSYLRRWLSKQQLDRVALRIRLTEKACAAAEGEDLGTAVRGFCWERHADALDDNARAAEPTEKAGWFDRVIAAYERSLNIRPDIADTLHNYANALVNRGRAAEPAEKAGFFDRAIAAYERSLTVRPDDPNTLANYATAFANRGQAAEPAEKTGFYDRAMAAYERSLTIRPDDPDTLNRFGITLDSRGRTAEPAEKARLFDRAIAAYERLLTLRPDNASVLSQLVSSLLLKRRVSLIVSEKESLLAQAKKLIARALELDASEARYNHACVLAVSGETERAIEEIRQLLAENPDERHEIAQDEDFESLTEHPEFRKLIGAS